MPSLKTLVMSGRVDELSLPDVLQTVASSATCTSVELHSDGGALLGRIWLQNGRVLAAERGRQQGREAFFGLFTPMPGDTFTVERIGEVPAHDEPLGMVG